MLTSVIFIQLEMAIAAAINHFSAGTVFIRQNRKSIDVSHILTSIDGSALKE